MTNTKQNLTPSQAQSYSNLTTVELQNLINEAQAGSQRALDQLCEQFRPLVEATARNYGYYRVLGEDAISICWLKLIELIISYAKPVGATFPGYLKQGLTNTLYDVVVKHADSEQSIDIEEEALSEISIDHKFEEQLAANNVMLEIVKELAPKEQRILYDYVFEELTFKQIAQRYGSKLNTIKSQYFRIRKKLRKAYTQKVINNTL